MGNRRTSKGIAYVDEPYADGAARKGWKVRCSDATCFHPVIFTFLLRFGFIAL
jgi:hypothetical protein